MQLKEGIGKDTGRASSVATGLVVFCRFPSSLQHRHLTTMGALQIWILFSRMVRRSFGLRSAHLQSNEIKLFTCLTYAAKPGEASKDYQPIQLSL